MLINIRMPPRPADGRRTKPNACWCWAGQRCVLCPRRRIRASGEPIFERTASGSSVCRRLARKPLPVASCRPYPGPGYFERTASGSSVCAGLLKAAASCIMPPLSRPGVQRVGCCSDCQAVADRVAREAHNGKNRSRSRTVGGGVRGGLRLRRDQTKPRLRARPRRRPGHDGGARATCCPIWRVGDIIGQS